MDIENVVACFRAHQHCRELSGYTVLVPLENFVIRSVCMEIMHLKLIK